MVKRKIIRKYAVFGNPIKHSLSPLIHKYFAKEFNIDLSYEPILGSIENFQTEAKEFLINGGLGFNITLPFKQEAFNMALTHSKVAEITKSVNTISLKDGVIHGDNTDGSGFIKDLKNNKGYQLQNKKVLLVGAGGAAMGVIPNILYESPKILSIHNRTFSKAEKLANALTSFGNIKAISETDIIKEKYDLIINATSIGISNLEFKLNNKIIHKNSVCYDMSYGKASNSFEKWATQNNLIFHNGLGMLLEQAADAFLIWESQRPSVTEELKKILEDNL